MNSLPPFSEKEIREHMHEGQYHTVGKYFSMSHPKQTNENWNFKDNLKISPNLKIQHPFLDSQ